MLESAEIGSALDKKTYQQELPALREALLAAQKELAGADFSVVVLLGGMEGAGKSETANRLLEWMDARGIETHAWREPSDEERDRPRMWRFWRRLPRAGRMAVFLDTWYRGPLRAALRGKLPRAELDQQLDQLQEFEQMLARENVLVVKFFLHLSKAAQKARLSTLEADPRQRWRVTRLDWKIHKRHAQLRTICEYALQRTSSAEAPWMVVEAQDAHYRNLTVARGLLAALQTRLRQAKTPRPASAPFVDVPSPVHVLSQLDLTKSIEEKEYEEKADDYQQQLAFLTRKLHERRKSMILAFEGPDAAGKGGAIRRLTAAMDARDYRVIAVAAPTDEEKGHPYLWRFWQHLPRHGRVTIYDRSWYGRVMVERIEGFCRPEDWQRAYQEINDFEMHLVDFGAIVLKFWLAVSPEEQMKRFESRAGTPYKQYKLTPDDWRNRAKWDAYQAAAVEMIERTGNPWAPWVLVEANQKEWARLKVLRTVVRRLKKEL